MYITTPSVNPVEDSTLAVFLANSLFMYITIPSVNPVDESTLSVILANSCYVYHYPVSEPSRRIYIVSVPSKYYVMYITTPSVNPVDESTLSVFLANSLLCISLSRQ